MIWLDLRVGPVWKPVTFQFSDGGGRAGWYLPPGTHHLRARFTGAGDLAAATSRAITVRGP